MLTAFAFYVFSGVLIAAALGVVAARNPVHSVLLLILSFFSAAGLFVLMGAEFLAMLLVVVYVGAVAVLFLFVVMMLDIDFKTLKQGFLDYAPAAAVGGAAFVGVLGLIFASWAFAPGTGSGVPQAAPDGLTNAEALGRVLYTDYILYFQISGLILLVAMVGAVVLTLRTRPGVRRQSVAAQVARTREQGVEVRNVKPGQGL